MRNRNRAVATVLPLVALAPLVMGAGGGCHPSLPAISEPTLPMPSPEIPVPVATADADPLDPLIGQSIICHGVPWPPPHGLSVQKIDGARYVVGEVDVRCVFPLKAFTLSLAVANLGTRAIHDTGSREIPGTGTGLAKKGVYVIQVLCVPGTYVLSWLAKVFTIDDRDSWFGNLGTPVTFTPRDCNQL